MFYALNLILHFFYRKYSNEYKIQAEDVSFRAARIDLMEPSSICFNNKYFHSSLSICDTPAANERCLNVNMHGRLHHVIAIKIGLHSMCIGSVPSVSKLEIWGVPSRNLEQNIVQDVVTKWKQYKESISTNRDNGQSLNSDLSIPSSQQVPNDKDFLFEADQPAMPKEFIDPLTFVMMINPVLLPSGQTIDQATLDKHIVTQSEWGRPPSDPFTGVVFSEQYQPVPNVALKLKLDRYHMSAMSTSSVCTEGSDAIRWQQRTPEMTVKRQNHNKFETSIYDCFESSSAGESSSVVADRRSIDESIEKTMLKAKSQPTNSRIIRAEFSHTNPLRCCKCKTLFSRLTSQYQLPCLHKLCRTCLLALSSIVCPQCSKIFGRKDVTRTFV